MPAVFILNRVRRGPANADETPPPPTPVSMYPVPKESVPLKPTATGPRFLKPTGAANLKTEIRKLVFFDFSRSSKPTGVVDFRSEGHCLPVCCFAVCLFLFSGIRSSEAISSGFNGKNRPVVFLAKQTNFCVHRKLKHV